MSWEVEYLRRSPRWTARLARGAIGAGSLAVPLLLGLAYMLSGPLFLGDRLLPECLTYYAAPVLAALWLFAWRGHWALKLSIYLVAIGAAFTLQYANFEAWDPNDPINRFLSATAATTYEEPLSAVAAILDCEPFDTLPDLLAHESPAKEQIFPIAKALFSYGLSSAMPWLLKHADDAFYVDIASEAVRTQDPDKTLLAGALRWRVSTEAQQQVLERTRTTTKDYMYWYYVDAVCHVDGLGAEAVNTWFDTYAEDYLGRWKDLDDNRLFPSSAALFERMQAHFKDELQARGVSEIMLVGGEKVFTLESLAEIAKESSTYHQFLCRFHPHPRRLPGFLEANPGLSWGDAWQSLHDGSRAYIRADSEKHRYLLSMSADLAAALALAPRDLQGRHAFPIVAVVSFQEYESLALRDVARTGDPAPWLSLPRGFEHWLPRLTAHPVLCGRDASDEEIRKIAHSLPPQDRATYLERYVQRQPGLHGCVALLRNEATPAIVIADLHDLDEEWRPVALQAVQDSSPVWKSVHRATLGGLASPDVPLRILLGVRMREPVYLTLLFLIISIALAMRTLTLQSEAGRPISVALEHDA
ncbi:MAG: hypothetical protein ACI8W8_001672 [Rhodothermales bacterium]|jgi:hypothetical protein